MTKAPQTENWPSLHKKFKNFCYIEIIFDVFPCKFKFITPDKCFISMKQNCQSILGSNYNSSAFSAECNFKKYDKYVHNHYS